MSRNRFRIATLCFLAPWSLAMIIASAESGGSLTGPVVGRVTYHGRPLRAGAIFFDPVDGDSGDPAAGLLGKDGSFYINQGWRRARSVPSKFRIAVLPQLWTSSGSPSARFEGPYAEKTSPPASEASGSRSPVAADPAIPRHYSKVQTSGLEVTLGRESSRIDIDLKD